VLTEAAMKLDDTHSQAPGTGRVGWFRRHPCWTIIAVLMVLIMTDIAFLPYATLIAFKDDRPEWTAFQRSDMQRQMKEGAEPSIRKEWVPYRILPKHLVRAVLVSEDALFWQHAGFDTFEIDESISRTVQEGKSLRGASTITQQLVKNLFLSSSRDPLRKVHELILTIVAENVLGKRRILELYLNEIEWGKGVYGAAAASRHYFGKPVTAIDVSEAAFLAAIIPAPTRYTPGTVTPYLEKRMARIRRRMGTGDSVLVADTAIVPVPSIETPVPIISDSPRMVQE